MSTISISLTRLRPKLPKILSRVAKFFDRYIITKHGQPEAVLLSNEDYESLMETIEILSDQKILQEIKTAEEDLKKGKAFSWEDVKKEIKNV